MLRVRFCCTILNAHSHQTNEMQLSDRNVEIERLHTSLEETESRTERRLAEAKESYDRQVYVLRDELERYWLSPSNDVTGCAPQ